MRFLKKTNVSDPTIQIRILKALDDNRPFGLFRNFYMVKILKNLKRPNVITSVDIWSFLGENFDAERYSEETDRAVFALACDFDHVYRGTQAFPYGGAPSP